MLAIPSNRIPAALATAIGTVNRLAQGRVFLGIGSGFTGRAVFGLPPVSIARFRRYIESCRTLLNGDEILHREGDTRRHIKLRHFEDRYIDPNAVPIYVAADAPRALELAGALGDGWITSLQLSSVMGNSPDVFASSLERVQHAAGEAGRSVDGSYTMWSVGFCVLEEGESPTSARALERIGAYAMLPFHAYSDNPAIEAFLPPPVRDRLPVYLDSVLARLKVPEDRRYQEVHRGHLSHLLDGEIDVLTDDIVRMTTLTGTAEEIVAVLRRLAHVGLRNVALNPPPHLVRETVDDWAEKIAPLLAKTLVSSGRSR